MKRPRTHQIDELAQQVFQASLPPSWIVNPQHRDYGKDYLVEMVDDDGTVTGSSFYVQLKGQEQVPHDCGRSSVSFRLAKKHAAYYVDRVRDLPVFLVLIDIQTKCGWWLFLQPALQADQRWRMRNSKKVELPLENTLADIQELSRAVHQAKAWMRQHHPSSIEDAIAAHKKRIVERDQRFNVQVSLVNEQPHFHLLAKEAISLKLSVRSDSERRRQKIVDLIDKGQAVAFDAGEVSISGSELFRDIEQTGCTIQARVDFSGTLTLIGRDQFGVELARLADIPGNFHGGQRESWFESGWNNSPLSLKIGPIAPGVGGSIRFHLDVQRWSGQSLRQLAYFDQLRRFFGTALQSQIINAEFCRDGNIFHSVTSSWHDLPVAQPFMIYLELLHKARCVAQRLNRNPRWTPAIFDSETIENVDFLFAVLLENGWRKDVPRVRLTAQCLREGFHLNRLKDLNTPRDIRLISDCSCRFCGEEIEIGRLIYEYSDMRIRLKQESSRLKSRSKHRDVNGRTSPSDTAAIGIELIGTKSTSLLVRPEPPVSNHDGRPHELLSSQSRVSFLT